MGEAELWSEKHAPVSIDGFVGNGERVREARAWALEWQRGNTQKPLLAFGRTGTGKTLLAQVIAREMGWDLFELNASDFRTRDIINRVAGAAAQNASFSGKRRLVLLDEVDGLSGREDKGGVAALSALLKNARQPIILTANDAYDRKLAGLRGVCQKLEFKKPLYTQVAKFLAQVCEAEGVEYDQMSLTALAKSSQGDLRSALLDLQAIAGVDKKIAVYDVEETGFRERSERIFETLSAIFHAKTTDDARRARNASDTSYDMLLLWMEENVPRHFNRGHADRARAMHYLSRADVFSGRIMRRQHYGFLKYVNELATSGAAIQREDKYPGFVSYQFPHILSALSRSRDARAMRKDLAKHIAKTVHGSSRRVITGDLPYLAQCFANPELAARMSAALDLDAEQISFITQKKATTKHVQKIHEQAREIRARALRERRSAPQGPLFAGTGGGGAQAEAAHGEEKDAPETAKKEGSEKGQTTLFGF